MTQTLRQVYGMAAWTNPLHSDAFPGLRKMEAEVLYHFLCFFFNTYFFLFMSWKVHQLVQHWYSRWSELPVTSSTVLQTPAGIKKQNDKIKNYFHICKIQKMLNNPNAPKVCYHWWDRVDNSGLQGLQGQRQRGWNWGSSCFLIFLVSYSSHGIIWWVSENNLSLLSSLLVLLHFRLGRC